MPSKKRAAASKTPFLLIAAGLILIVGSIIWFVLSPGMQAQPTPTAQDIPYPEVPRISVKDAKAALGIGNAVFIDVRGEPYFSEGHIPGAISMTYDEVMDRLGELDSAAWIITYCT